MTINNYVIGLVVGNMGLNANQMRDITARLKFITKNMDAHGQVLLVVPAFTRPDLETGVHPDVRRIERLPQVTISSTPNFFAYGSLHLSQAYADLKGLDEVWCCPGLNQATLRARAVTNQIYRYAQSRGGDFARVFKLIPPWVGEDDTVKLKKEN